MRRGEWGGGWGYLADHVRPGEFLLKGLIIRPHQEESYIKVVMKLARLILGSLKQREGGFVTAAMPASLTLSI